MFFTRNKVYNTFKSARNHFDDFCIDKKSIVAKKEVVSYDYK